MPIAVDWVHIHPTSQLPHGLKCAHAFLKYGLLGIEDRPET